MGRGSVIEIETCEQRRCPGRWSILGVWRFALLRWTALVLLLVVYAYASLEPFDWRFSDRLINGATPLTEGWSFPTAGLVIAEPPLDTLRMASQAETLDVFLEVRPRATSQWGPARILTISADPYLRNLTLGQYGDDLVVRLRTEETDLNGRRGGRPVARLRHVFQAGKWVAIDLRLRPGRLTVAIDGAQELAATLPTSVLGTWDPGFGLALGNEMTCDRPWLGDIRKAVMTGPEGAIDYARIEQVDVPATCTLYRHPPKLVPLVPLNLKDALLNTVMYLPLGCLLGLMMRRRNRHTFAVLVLVIAGISLSFETLQLLLPSRFPSVDDIIFNTLGGALGLAFGTWLMKRLAPWLPAC
jgi:hypothetical protein